MDIGVCDMSTVMLLQRYEQVYRKLYMREPSEIRDLGKGWVLVNGARMQVGELERLTDQMVLEYRQATIQKRSVVTRLMEWLRNG